MYTIAKLQNKTYGHTTIKCHEQYPAETLEQKLERIFNNGETPDGSAPLTYTEKDEGIPASMNVRSDKWEYAAEAADKIYEQKEAINQMKKEGATWDTMTTEEQEKYITKYPHSEQAQILAKAQKLARKPSSN